MSSKIPTLAALLILVALLAIAEATTYTTITTYTTTIDEEAAAINPSGQRRSQCQQEIPMQKMSYCQTYMQSQESIVRMVAVNPRGMEQHFRQCCQQLRGIDYECRCDAIKMVMQQLIRTGEMEEIMRRAMELPQRCGVDVPRECDMQ